MGILKEVQGKGIGNIFNKIIAENFPNLEKELSIQIQEAFSTPNSCDYKRTSSWHIIAKTISTNNEERILKAIRKKTK
jgi:hypothetical protein